MSRDAPGPVSHFVIASKVGTEVRNPTKGVCVIPTDPKSPLECTECAFDFEPAIRDSPYILILKCQDRSCPKLYEEDEIVRRLIIGRDTYRARGAEQEIEATIPPSLAGWPKKGTGEDDRGWRDRAKRLTGRWRADRAPVGSAGL